MDNFWIWLKKANARAVFYSLLAALLIVSAWWTWQLMTPIQIPPPPATGTAQDQPTPTLGILAYLKTQQTTATNQSANIFIPPENFSQPQPPAKNQDTTPASATQSKPDSQKPAAKPPPPRPKEMVTLTYKGMFVRSDGVHVALIEDSKSKRATFYPPGKVLFGLKIMTIEAELLGASAPDLAEVTLKRGVPATLPGD